MHCLFTFVNEQFDKNNKSDLNIFSKFQKAYKLLKQLLMMLISSDWSLLNCCDDNDNLTYNCDSDSAILRHMLCFKTLIAFNITQIFKKKQRSVFQIIALYEDNYMDQSMNYQL